MRIRCTYISGSFCVSMTAAMGIPKLLAGPQKSVRTVCQSLYLQASPQFCPSTMFLALYSASHPREFSTSQAQEKLTSRAQVVGHGVRPDARIERFDRGCHFDVAVLLNGPGFGECVCGRATGPGCYVRSSLQTVIEVELAAAAGVFPLNEAEVVSWQRLRDDIKSFEGTGQTGY